MIAVCNEAGAIVGGLAINYHGQERYVEFSVNNHPGYDFSNVPTIFERRIRLEVEIKTRRVKYPEFEFEMRQGFERTKSFYEQKEIRRELGDAAQLDLKHHIEWEKVMSDFSYVMTIRIPVVRIPDDQMEEIFDMSLFHPA